MGQGQSQSQRPSTPEPVLSPEEQAKHQAQMRAQQQAALDKRLAAQTKKPTPTSSSGAQPTKKPSALEQMSKENLGWRNADAQHDLRSWN